MKNYNEIKLAMMEYDEETAVSIMADNTLSHVEAVCLFLEKNPGFYKECGVVIDFDDDAEMISYCEEVPAWDYATDIMENLAAKYGIDLEDGDGEWKTGDEVLAQIKPKIGK